MLIRTIRFSLIIPPALTADAVRVKRQSSGDDPKKEESFEQELCKDKDAGEWFRLVAGEGDNCRDVIQCTSSVSVMMIVDIQISSRTSALERGQRTTESQLTTVCFL